MNVKNPPSKHIIIHKAYSFINTNIRKEEIMVENKVLRQNARAQMDNNIFSSTWLMLMVVYLIYSAISSAASSFSCGIAAIVITGPMLYGVNRICVNVVRGNKKIQIEDMFVGFKECFTESFLLTLLTGLFTLLWSLLFIIPGIIKSYSYAMAPYILQDDPSKGWKMALDESKEMMEGHKWQLFCLDVSFIGWYIVGFLCCCVGVIFVEPYVLMARANFYMALKAMNEPEQSEFDENNGFEQVDPFA